MKREALVSIDDPDWLSLRSELWPDCPKQEHLEEMASFLREPTRFVQFIVRDDEERGVGLAEASIRSDYVNGTSSSPVAFLEGLYVRPVVRGRGIARSLVEAVSEWALSRGCSELASDTQLENLASQAVHERLGFVETERTVCFRKSLDPEDATLLRVTGRVSEVLPIGSSSEMNAISRLREDCRPAEITVLFVAESPPESGEDEVRFFYNPRQERWDHLYRSVMTAIFPEFVYRPGEKNLWLRKFQSAGYYLIDATDRPVNRLGRAERLRELDAAVQPKVSEIASLVTRDTPIVLVKKNVFAALNHPLRAGGFNVIHETFLPFPSHGNQARFIERCRNCLREYRRAG